MSEFNGHYPVSIPSEPSPSWIQALRQASYEQMQALSFIIVVSEIF